MHIRKLFFGLVCSLVISLPAHPSFSQIASDTAQQVTEHMRQAQAYLREKKPELAIPEFRKIVALEPEDLNARANLGVLLFFQGDYTGAIPQLRAALKLKPGLWKIQALLGTSEKRTGNLKDGAANLESAFANLDEKTIRVETGLELIEADSALGLLSKAATVAGELRQIDPDNPAILSTAYQIYSQLTDETLLDLAVAAPESAEMHMLMAHELVRQGNNAGALTQYRAAIKINPKLPGLHFEYAELLHNSADPALKAQAEAQYKAALDVNQFDEKAMCGLGSIAASRGNLKEAEAEYSRALQLQPNDSEAETDLAKVYISMNEKTKALSLLESAVETDPTNFTAHYRLSTLYRQMGRPADAKRELDEFLHYKDLKEKFGKVFQQMRVQTAQSGMN